MDTQKEYIASLDPRIEAVATEMASNRPHNTGTTPIPNGDELEYAEELVTAMDGAVPPQTTDEKLDEILSLLRPLAPALRALPEVVEQVGPIIDGLKKSPVLKALGVRIP